MNVKLEGYGEVSKIDLYDVMGRLVYTKSELNKIEIFINVSGFEAGIYLLRVE